MILKEMKPLSFGVDASVIKPAKTLNYHLNDDFMSPPSIRTVNGCTTSWSGTSV